MEGFIPKMDLGKAVAAKQQKQFLGFMTMCSKLCSVKFDSKVGTCKEIEELVNPCIKEIALFDQFEISKVFHCDGLVLCVAKEEYTSRLMLWNPYLGQTRWIEISRESYKYSHYLLGYDDNNNHKILRLSRGYYGRVDIEINRVGSSSWRFLEIISPDCIIEEYYHAVTVKGNSYLFAREPIMIGQVDGRMLVTVFLLCFDFTRECFGQRLHLPFDHMYGLETMIISGVREEQLAVLYQKTESDGMLEIWVTDKIDPNAVSWSKFLVVDMRPFPGIQINEAAGSFFIDEEKKVAVVFDEDVYEPTQTDIIRNQTAYIIGQDGYFKSIKIGENPYVLLTSYPDVLPKFFPPAVSSSYLPSLVQIN